MKLDRNLVTCSLSAIDQNDLFKQMTSKIVANGYAKEAFLQDLLNRENEFPTGLKVEGVSYAFAVPHAYPKNVLKDGIAVATLTQPIPFKSMVDPETTVDVEIVFMLASKDSQLHIKLLSDIVTLFKNPEFPQTIMQAKTAEQLAAYVESEVEKYRESSEND